VWFLISTVASRIIPALRVVTIAGLRGHSASNVNLPAHVTGTVALLAVAQTVLIAPPVEELLFRGLVLRAAMRRFPFLPSALGSSLIFGIFHAWQGTTWQGAIILAATTATFGFVQCLLVRRTGRLGPAIAGTPSPTPRPSSSPLLSADAWGVSHAGSAPRLRTRTSIVRGDQHRSRQHFISAALGPPK
jgi:hypothetical protein